MPTQVASPATITTGRQSAVNTASGRLRASVQCASASGTTLLFSFHRPDAVDLIQPTDGIARQHVGQQAAILGDTFGLIANMVSQIQAVVGGLADPSLAGTHADLNTVECWVGVPRVEAMPLSRILLRQALDKVRQILGGWGA